jgi:hypothetical protein
MGARLAGGWLDGGTDGLSKFHRSWVVGWLGGRRHGWMGGRFENGRLDRDWMAAWLDWLVSRRIGWWMAGWLDESGLGWLRVGWMAGWFEGWLVGAMVASWRMVVGMAGHLEPAWLELGVLTKIGVIRGRLCFWRPTVVVLAFR